ncbi:MAG: TetR/AcrR family transcriptional regulator [Angustibacter sp.]
MPKTIDRDARKAQLAEAVWQVILDRGIGAVSVRTVAEQAGVVVGSLRHVFATRAELVRFSAELMVQRATERIDGVPRGDDDQQYALDVLKQLLPLEPDSRAELEINLALFAESPALPELEAIRDQAYQALAEGCTRLVELLMRRPRDPQVIELARRLHAIVDGLALHLLVHAHAHAHAHDSDWAIEIIRNELATITRAASTSE